MLGETFNPNWVVFNPLFECNYSKN